ARFTASCTEKASRLCPTDVTIAGASSWTFTSGACATAGVCAVSARPAAMAAAPATRRIWGVRVWMWGSLLVFLWWNQSGADQKLLARCRQQKDRRGRAANARPAISEFYVSVLRRSLPSFSRGVKRAAGHEPSASALAVTARREDGLIAAADRT